MLRILMLALCSLSFVSEVSSMQEEPEEALTLQEEPEEALSNRMANYRINAKLDERGKILTGTVWLEWRNMTAYDTREIHFHLFQNAFKHTESAFYQMSSPWVRDSVDDVVDAWGFIEVQSLAYTIRETDHQLDFTDVTQQPENSAYEDAMRDFRIRAPKRYPKDESTAILYLKRALRRGESIWVKMDFRVKLPEPGVARSGISDDYYLFSQWFPKVGFFENGKWICNPYNPMGEFYSNFGVYQVLLDVPKEFVVGATGVRVFQSDRGNRQLITYEAKDVIDFAWTASPLYKEYREKVDDVELIVLMQPEHEHLAQRHLDAARASLRYFAEALGPLPYPSMTIVDPPDDGAPTSGMEYPMFVTAGTYTTFPGDKFIEAVIAHEIAHNYFQSIIATNEFKHPWMDEGFAQYLDARFVESYEQPKGAYFSLWGWHVTSAQITRMSYLRRPERPPPSLPSDMYQTYGDYGFAAYTKPAMLLHTLDLSIGRERMDQLLAAYVERYSFRHPKPNDFFAVVEEFAGAEHRRWLEQGLETSAWVNYRVNSMTSDPKPEKRGLGYQWDLKSFKEIEEPEVPMEPNYIIQVAVQREGDLEIPTTLRLTYEDGATEDMAISGKERFFYLNIERAEPLKSAVVDPEHQIFIDRNWLDNSRLKQTNPNPKRSLVESWLHALQTAMIFAGP
jgi:hypothetical protein